MRTLNVKRVVILLVVVVVIAGSTHLLHSYQLQRNSATFKTQATAAWDDHPRRVADAVRLMRVYLALAPKDYEAREQLGSWYFESGRPSNASLTLEELLRVLDKQVPPDPARVQAVRRKLIEAYMAQARCEDAVYYLEMLKQEVPGDVQRIALAGEMPDYPGENKRPRRRPGDPFHGNCQLPDRVDLYYQKAMTLRFPPVENVPEAEKCMAEMIAYWEKRSLPQG